MRAWNKTFALTENITFATTAKSKHRLIHSTLQRSEAAVLIDGRERANAIQEQLRHETVYLQERGFSPPRLTTILVGDNFVSHLYVKRKVMAADKIGIVTDTIHLPSTINESDLISVIKSLNEDRNVHGILVQLPLPLHISERTISNSISPSKDVDGFSTLNVGQYVQGSNTLSPCTAMAVRDLVQSTGLETKGKHCVVVGRSKNVGLPIAIMLHSAATGGAPGLDMTTTICHRFTPIEQLTALTKLADVLVSAAGVPGLITARMVKKGACVIDVGITRLPKEYSNRVKLVGDVAFEEVKEVAAFLTPVPGGVGPMTVVMLMKNTIKAAKQQMAVPPFPINLQNLG